MSAPDDFAVVVPKSNVQLINQLIRRQSSKPISAHEVYCVFQMQTTQLFFRHHPWMDRCLDWLVLMFCASSAVFFPINQCQHRYLASKLWFLPVASYPEFQGDSCVECLLLFPRGYQEWLLWRSVVDTHYRQWASSPVFWTSRRPR